MDNQERCLLNYKTLINSSKYTENKILFPTGDECCGAKLLKVNQEHRNTLLSTCAASILLNSAKSLGVLLAARGSCLV
jgi:hypothetical protein